MKYAKPLMLLCLLLAVLLSLPACTGGGEIPLESETDAETVPDSGAAAPPTVLELVKDGRSDYRIVYADDASEAIRELARALQQAIRDCTGATVLLSAEEDTVGGSDAKEILIGPTTRAESQAVLERLPGYLDYAVEASGSKLVLAGQNDEATVRCVYYFINQYLKSEGDSDVSELTFSSEENYMYHYSYPMKDLSVLGHPLSDYRLVIPAEAGITELRFANYYRNYLGQMTGVNLQIVSDTEPAADCEIRIGATSRTVSTVERYEYAVTVTGDSVEILADSLYGYEAAYVYAQNQLLSDLRKAEPDCGELVSVDIRSSLSGGTEHILQKSGDLRIMYHNIWGWNESETNPTDQRNRMLAATYLEYMPDVLCLQECTMMMRNSEKYPIAQTLKEAGYEEVSAAPVTTTATPILYRTDVLKLIASGAHKFEVGGGDDKYATWAVFETKADGQRFAVVSVHLAYQQTAEGNGWRYEQVGTVSELVAQLQSTYACPVITGGDMNCTTTSDPYKRYLENGFADVQTLAAETDDSNTNFGYPSFSSAIGMFERPSVGGGSYRNDAIDHVFASGSGLRFDLFDIVTDNYVLCASDHTPLLVDFSFDENAGTSGPQEPITEDSEWTWRY